MEILIVESDPLLRDQIKVGLQNFHQFSVECGYGYAGVNRARQKRYDYIILGIGEPEAEGVALLKALREFDRETEVVVAASKRRSRTMTDEKSKLNIFSFLEVPIDVDQFFRVLSRLRPRPQPAAGPH